LRRIASYNVKACDIQDEFWRPRLQLDAETAIYHQWAQLEKTGCIENFRLAPERHRGLAAGGKAGFREGYFFADSDAFKWLDAAARVYRSHPSARLKGLMDGFIALIRRAQADDGYIYTYNQLLFPETRWANLQIEHELYCHGHLIEAAVSYFEATSERVLLEIGIRAADLLVREFAGAGPEGTPDVDLFAVHLKPATLRAEFSAGHFGGVTVLRGQTVQDQPLTFIPYFLWANRGESKMTVYVTMLV